LILSFRCLKSPAAMSLFMKASVGQNRMAGARTLTDRRSSMFGGTLCDFAEAGGEKIVQSMDPNASSSVAVDAAPRWRCG
ncbi:MAG TPA: hypothetical protein VKB34_21550, partial [Povalibacter sp.]|nr:hypothetical protein [Povalibacter sp.]